MEDVQIGLKIAIESTIVGLYRARVLDDAKLETVLHQIELASRAASQSLPRESDLVESIVKNVRVIVRQTPL